MVSCCFCTLPYIIATIQAVICISLSTVSVAKVKQSNDRFRFERKQGEREGQWTENYISLKSNFSLNIF